MTENAKLLKITNQTLEISQGILKMFGADWRNVVKWSWYIFQLTPIGLTQLMDLDYIFSSVDVARCVCFNDSHSQRMKKRIHIWSSCICELQVLMLAHECSI